MSLNLFTVLLSCRNTLVRRKNDDIVQRLHCAGILAVQVALTTERGKVKFDPDVLGEFFSMLGLSTARHCPLLGQSASGINFC